MCRIAVAEALRIHKLIRAHPHGGAGIVIKRKPLLPKSRVRFQIQLLGPIPPITVDVRMMSVKYRVPCRRCGYHHSASQLSMNVIMNSAIRVARVSRSSCEVLERVTEQPRLKPAVCHWKRKLRRSMAGGPVQKFGNNVRAPGRRNIARIFPIPDGQAEPGAKDFGQNPLVEVEEPPMPREKGPRGVYIIPSRAHIGVQLGLTQ